MQKERPPMATKTLTLPNKKAEPSMTPPDAADETVQISAKLAAADEERAAAQRAEMIAAMQQEPEVVHENLASAAAKGRDHLLQKLRERDARIAAEAAAEAARPTPVLSEKMQAKLDEEMAAGRRAQAKHQARADAAPPPVPEKVEQVARPGNVVPDPLKTPTNTSVSGTFAAGHRGYSPNV